MFGLFCGMTTASCTHPIYIQYIGSSAINGSPLSGALHFSAISLSLHCAMMVLHSIIGFKFNAIVIVRGIRENDPDENETRFVLVLVDRGISLFPKSYRRRLAARLGLGHDDANNNYSAGKFVLKKNQDQPDSKPYPFSIVTENTKMKDPSQVITLKPKPTQLLATMNHFTLYCFTVQMILLRTEQFTIHNT